MVFAAQERRGCPRDVLELAMGLLFDDSLRCASQITNN
jgi:hypothetical protein